MQIAITAATRPPGFTPSSTGPLLAVGLLVYNLSNVLHFVFYVFHTVTPYVLCKSNTHTHTHVSGSYQIRVESVIGNNWIK